jgi:hypothetical protein
MSAVTRPVERLLGKRDSLGKPTSEGSSGRAFPVLVEAMDKSKAANAQSSGGAPSSPLADAAATQAAANRRARRRGGRTLLSESRLNPELGVGQTTLGAGPT